MSIWLRDVHEAPVPLNDSEELERDSTPSPLTVRDTASIAPPAGGVHRSS